MREACIAVVRSGADCVRRARLRLADIASFDPPLADLLAYWQGKRGDRPMPAKRDIDPLDLRKALGRIHIVETAGRTPLEFRYRLWGSDVSYERGRDFTDTTVGEAEPAIYRDAVAADYFTAVSTGAPAYQEVEAQLDFLTYRYGRLLLPLSDDGRTVSHLLVCIHERPLRALVDARPAA